MPTDIRPVVRSFDELARSFNGDFSFAQSRPEVEQRSFQEVARAWTTYNGGATGGFLLDYELANGVFDKARAIDGPLQRCLFHKTTKHSFSLPGFEETTRVNGSRWGGIRAYWVGQEDDKTLSATTSTAGVAASQPSLNEINFEMQRCIVYTQPYSNDLVADAPLFGPMMEYAANQEIQYALVDKMINGDGNGCPTGVVNAASTVRVTRAGSASTMAIADIDGMWSKLWPYCKRSAIWLASDSSLTVLDAVARAGGWPASDYQPAGHNGNQFALIKGRPLIPCEQCPKLGQTGDLICGDFSQYLVCVRANSGGIELESSLNPVGSAVERTVSEHIKFDTDQSVCKYKFRADGRPMWRSTVVLPDGSGQAQGPFVVLV